METKEGGIRALYDLYSTIARQTKKPNNKQLFGFFDLYDKILLMLYSA